MIILGIHGESQPPLAHVVQAFNRLCPLFGRIQRRQQHRRQNGNDGNDYEEFDEGECPAGGVYWRYVSGFHINTSLQGTKLREFEGYICETKWWRIRAPVSDFCKSSAKNSSVLETKAGRTALAGRKNNSPLLSGMLTCSVLVSRTFVKMSQYQRRSKQIPGKSQAILSKLFTI